MAHQCQNCTFVANLSSIRGKVLSDEKLLKRLGKKPVFVGTFTSTDWAGHSNFYALKCPECGELVVDYAHGYTGGGYLYFMCKDCSNPTIPEINRTNITIDEQSIYDSAGLDKPGSLFREIWESIKLKRKLAAQTRG